MKKIVIVIAIIIVGLLGWQYRFWLQKQFQQIPELAKNPFIAQIQQNISTPPPLVSSLFSANSHLTDAGVIEYTNQNRLENGGLAALKENPVLDEAAKYKLEDLFKKQYFEHISPSGAGPADLAKVAGYAYISIGENLAMGNFKDDQELVTAWMNSPGHRANILDKKFTEIGVAVGRGTYQGKQTWIAVQEFGQPSSSCPAVNIALKTKVDFEQQQASQQESQLINLKSQLDAVNPKTPDQYQAYNQQVAEYNNLISVYNNQVDKLKLDADQYNFQVNAYNACAGQ